jgi:hypothetical protein
MSYDNNLAPSTEVVAGSFSKQQGRDVKDNLRQQQQLRRTLQESFDDPIGSLLQDDPFFNPEIMNTIINSFTNSSSNMTNITGLSPEEFANLTLEEIGQIMDQQGANNDDEMATLYNQEGIGSVITNLTDEIMEGIGPIITNLTDEIMDGANNYTNDEGGGGGGLSMEDLATLYQGIGPVITNLTDTVIDEFYNASSELSIEDMLADLVNATSSSSPEEEDYYDDAVTGIEEDEGVVPDYSNATTDFSSTEGGQNSNEQVVEGGNDDDKVGYDDTTNSEEEEEESSTVPPAMSSSGGNFNEDESEFNMYPTPVPEPDYSWYGNGGPDEEVDDEYGGNIEEGAGDDEFMAGDDKNGDGIPDEFESMTTRPTAAYVPPPNDEDPLAEEEEMEDEEEDHVLYHGLGGAAGEYLDGVESPLEMEKDKNVQVTVGILMSLFVILLLVTASLVMNHPDGLCAGCCRLTLKVLSCCFRTLCLPCRAICCGGSEQTQGRRTHAPMRSPFPSDLELT